MKLTYDKISPITGNNCVLTEYDDLHGETRLCMESGYQNLERFIDGSDVVDRFEQTCPIFLKESRFVDDKNRVWYKTLLVTPTLVLLPEWKIVSLREANESDDISDSQFTLVKDDKVFIIDEPNAVHYDSFEIALDTFYKILNQDYV